MFNCMFKKHYKFVKIKKLIFVFRKLIKLIKIKIRKIYIKSANILRHF